MHSLKQIVSQDASLTSMAFDEQDYRQAAAIYDNLNSTARFYTTALRALSKADWSAHVEFEDHIVHQAMKAVAQGWTTAINLRNYNFGPFHLALAMCTLPEQLHGEVQRTFDSMAVNLPEPFLQKICSLVTFECRVCAVSTPHFVSTFFVCRKRPWAMTFSMQLYHGQINCCQVLQEASDSVAMSVLLLVTPLLILAQLAAWFGYSTQGHPIRKPTLT